MSFESVVSDEGGYADPFRGDDGATFYPVHDAETGCLGFRIEDRNGQLPTRYIYLSPSGDGGRDSIYDSCIFVYRENAGHITHTNTECYISVWDDDDAKLPGAPKDTRNA